MLYNRSHSGTDLLTHEQIVGDAEADHRLGDHAGELGPYEDQTLSEGQRAGDSSDELVHREWPKRANPWREHRRDGLGEQISRRQAVQRQDQIHLRNLRRDIRCLRNCCNAVDQSGNHAIENSEEQPYGHRR